MNPSGIFDAPIPGQSLTQAPGASPVEHPPQFVHLDEALEFTWEQIHKKKPAVKLITLLKGGMPVQALAQTIIYQGLLQSKWSVDLALLMLQTVMWQIEAVAKLKGIKVKTFNDDREYQQFLLQSDQLLAQQQSNTSTADAAPPTPPEQSGTGFKGFSFGGAK